MCNASAVLAPRFELVRKMVSVAGQVARGKNEKKQRRPGAHAPWAAKKGSGDSIVCA